MTKNLVQTPLDPKTFTEVLNGPATQRVAYLRAHRCPCWDAARSGPDQECPVCGGQGYHWDGPSTGSSDAYAVELIRASLNDDEILSPTPTTILTVAGEDGRDIPPGGLTWDDTGRVSWTTGQPQPEQYEAYTVTYAAQPTLRALITRVTTMREFQERGEYEVTDLQITVDRHQGDGTPNPAWDAGEADRFVLLDTWRRYSTHLQRQRTRPSDPIIYRRARAPIVTSIVSGAVHTWINGTDYTFQDGNVTWTAGRGPQHGAHYALECEVSPEYFVFEELPQTRQINGQDLPRRLLLRGFEKFSNRK